MLISALHIITVMLVAGAQGHLVIYRSLGPGRASTASTAKSVFNE